MSTTRNVGIHLSMSQETIDKFLYIRKHSLTYVSPDAILRDAIDAKYQSMIQEQREKDHVRVSSETGSDS